MAMYMKTAIKKVRKSSQSLIEILLSPELRSPQDQPKDTDLTDSPQSLSNDSHLAPDIQPVPQTQPSSSQAILSSTNDSPAQAGHCVAELSLPSQNLSAILPLEQRSTEPTIDIDNSALTLSTVPSVASTDFRNRSLISSRSSTSIES